MALTAIPSAQPSGGRQAPASSGDDRRALLAALGVEPDGLPDTVRAALEALAGEVLSLRQDRTRLQTALEQAELLADHDALCPVFNRRAFERELTREIALAQRFRSPLCLIYLDLDNFKLVNDRFGHATGDTVIQHIAALLLKHVRQTDIVGRLGGDEFGIALTHADFANSRSKAETLVAEIDGLTVRDSGDATLGSVQLGASCGVVEWQPQTSAAQLLHLADEAMFRAKARRKSGPGGVPD